MPALLTMYDDVAVDVLPAADYFAAYVDGRFANIAAIKAKFPHATVLSIAVFPQDDADCLDVEPGDATRADIFGWFKRQQARGVARPCVYSSVSGIDGIVATMTANGFHRDSYRLWSAHYTGTAHVCSPSTCRLTQAQCDGTQYTDHAMSRSLDESVLLPGFFAAPPPPVPAPAPDPQVPVPAAPEMVTTGGNQGLRGFAHYHSMSPQSVIWLTAVQKPGGFGSGQGAYISGGNWDENMPSGSTWWIGPTP